jgi:hypothetical protein
MTNVEYYYGVGAVAATLVFIGAMIIFSVRRQARQKKWEPPKRRVDTKPIIATMEEKTEFSSGGVAALALMILFNLLQIFSLVLAVNILQQTVSALIWIGINILCCTGLIIGRKRSYIVRRELPLD